MVRERPERHVAKPGVMERIVVGGNELEYDRIAGTRPGAPVLVFLHEGLGSAGLWRDFPTALVRHTGCGALVYSRYGNGFSSPLRQPRTPRYMHDEALTALPELLKALGIGETILVGHSDGASIALIFAAAFPAAVRGLVLEAPHVFVEELSVRSIAAIKAPFESGDLRRRMERHHTDAERTFYAWNDVWLSHAFRQWNVESEVARVRAPILAFQGADDEYGTFAQLDAISESANGRVDRVLLAGCGHTPHRDRRPLVEAVAAAWVRATME